MLFNFYDVDGDGTLSLEEFKLACQVPAIPARPSIPRPA